MINIQDITAFSKFQRDPRAHLKKLRKTGRPALLTVNGEPAIVIMDAKAWEEWTANMEIHDRPAN